MEDHRMDKLQVGDIVQDRDGWNYEVEEIVKDGVWARAIEPWDAPPKRFFWNFGEVSKAPVWPRSATTGDAGGITRSS
jgi:hypothetical protein